MSKDEQVEELEQFDYPDDEGFEDRIKGYPELIGSFLVSFSILEHELNNYIADYVSDRAHDTGYRMVEKLRFANKIDFFSSGYLGYEVMLFNKQGADTKSIGKIRKALTEINKFRNIIAHANWLTLNEKFYVRTKIFIDGDDGLVKFTNKKITKEMISAMIVKVDSMSDAIYEYIEDFNNRANSN